MADVKPLTPKQEAFCQEFMVDRNRKQAAIRVGYSEKSAEVQGSRLHRNAKVKARIDELTAAQQKRTEITADRVLKELGRIAFLDLGVFYDDHGALLLPKDMPPSARRALGGIKIFEEFDYEDGKKHKIGETREIKPYDKVAALRLLGQHLKMFTQKVELDVSENLAEKLARARKRAGKK